MSDYTCSIDGCAKKFKARGWCNTHYEMWRITGSPVRKARPAPEDEIAAKTKREGDCLVWTGYLTPVGYGQITYKGRARRVHAVATAKREELFGEFAGYSRRGVDERTRSRG
ncbi:HNH endonuclease [Brevibacterium phage Rousseau]|nr:HNH endonuclease [Brevibacterium phage Rousseau]